MTMLAGPDNARTAAAVSFCLTATAKRTLSVSKQSELIQFALCDCWKHGTITSSQYLVLSSNSSEQYKVPQRRNPHFLITRIQS
jgi:hypothetical protein